MAIVITDNLDCLVDGVNFGQPADVIANNVALAPGVNVAMRAKLDAVRAEKTTAQAEIATAQAEKAAAQTEAEAAKTKAAAIAAAVKVLPVELPGDLAKDVDDVLLSEKEKKLAELAAEIAAKQAELDALNSKT